MEQLQQREWYELQSRTWQLLREREHILRSKHRPLLQYLVRPSFTDTWCIDIVRTHEILAAYRTVWRMTSDINAFATGSERLKHPRPYSPTLASSRLDIASNVVESLLDRFNNIEIPLRVTDNQLSIDGVSFELQIGDGFTGISLMWHNELPLEWSAKLQAAICELNEIESSTSSTGSNE